MLTVGVPKEDLRGFMFLWILGVGVVGIFLFFLSIGSDGGDDSLVDCGVVAGATGLGLWFLR